MLAIFLSLGSFFIDGTLSAVSPSVYFFLSFIHGFIIPLPIRMNSHWQAGKTAQRTPRSRYSFMPPSTTQAACWTKFFIRELSRYQETYLVHWSFQLKSIVVTLRWQNVRSTPLWNFLNCARSWRIRTHSTTEPYQQFIHHSNVPLKLKIMSQQIHRLTCRRFHSCPSAGTRGWQLSN